MRRPRLPVRADRKPKRHRERFMRVAFQNDLGECILSAVGTGPGPDLSGGGKIVLIGAMIKKLPLRKRRLISGHIGVIAKGPP